MRRIVVIVGVVVVVIALFVAVFFIRQQSTLPTAASLVYDFSSKVGNTAIYDVSLIVTSTVGSTSPSVTTVDVPVRAKVLSTDKAGVATVQLNLDQPTIHVDGTLSDQPLKVTQAVVRVSPNGQVDSVVFPGATRTISITANGGNDAAVQIGTVTAQGGSDPLESVLLLAENSLPALPSGQIKVDQQWARPSVINAPYMLLESAVANSKLEGFERDNEINVARIRTQSTMPVDVQTYQANGSPLHVTGTQSLTVVGYFAPSLGVMMRTTGTGHVELTQNVSAGSTTMHAGNLTISEPSVHSVTDVSFSAVLRQ